MQVVDREPEVHRSIARGVTVAIVVGVVAGGAAWWGIASRATTMAALTEETRQMAIRTVAVVHPKRGAPQQEIVLPGSMQAFTDAPIYARTSGYLKRRLVDMGAHVSAGQLLAEIDAPELEQQLQQARADLATADANQRLAQVTATRYRDLRRNDAVSQQDADNAAGALDARKTAVESAQHNVQRLEELQAYTKIYAPFAGVVTARNTDVGALIDPGSAGGPDRELFHVAVTDRLRIFVNVPETYARYARAGLIADITLQEFPGRRFAGKLVRTAESFDAASRTLLTEVDVDNPKGELLPGGYAEVHLKLPVPAELSTVPVNTLIFRGDGLRVAILRDGSRVALVPVTPGRDFGTEMEIVSGLNGDETVVVNPPDSLVDGERVRVASPPAASGGGGPR
jgi:RND family efflux transporter MFP subunit